MTSDDLRKKFIEFYKKLGHKEIPSARLVLENDPTTLFTGSGMQPLIPYFLGEKHPLGEKLVNSQKCFRAVDIDCVGDNRHTSFFEMLGNWSLGDYFKKEQLARFLEFLVKEIGIDPKKLYVTVFSGDQNNNIPKDTESVEIWKKIFQQYGIDAKAVELITVERGSAVGIERGRIFYYGAEKNWWSRAGVPDKMPAGELGGPDSEVFYEFTNIKHNKKFGKHCHPNCECGRFLEIGNSVFLEYKKVDDGCFEPLLQKNVDFGGGLERILSALGDNQDIFSIDILSYIIGHLEKLSKKSYHEKNFQKSFRIISDHFRAILFLLADGVKPANTEQGYFVRRLIRRSVRHMDLLGIRQGGLEEVIQPVIHLYKEAYPYLESEKQNIYRELLGEEKKFRATLKAGLKEFEKISSKDITGRVAFMLFSSYGLPIDIQEELAKEKGLVVDIKGFEEEYKKHQKISRIGAEKKFKGGLKDHSYETTKGHTATHLLLAALRRVLGEHVSQKGSNITSERLRLDFSHIKKLTKEEIQKIEDLVNEQIQKNIPVVSLEMTLFEAKKEGALGVFDQKYGERVKVYSIGDFSKEICGGPHVKNIGELELLKIVQETASSAGIRRIKAIVGKRGSTF